jgi:hypothetical protein
MNIYYVAHDYYRSNQYRENRCRKTERGQMMVSIGKRAYGVNADKIARFIAWSAMQSILSHRMIYNRLSNPRNLVEMPRSER